MFGRVSRGLFSASLLVVLAGCNSLGFGGGDKQPATDVTVAPQASGGDPAAAAAAPGNMPTVIAGKCPQVVILDQNSVHKIFAGNSKDDPSQLRYQASLAEGTRQCTSDGTHLNIKIAVQGRLVAGPAGGNDQVTLPIHVAVTDNNTSLYSETVNYPVSIPAGQTTGQFIFTDDRISVAGGAGGFVSVQVGFDEGAQKPAKATGHRKKK